ncbi:hypothetical protein, partial [Staphylococcus aureus]|uniref:hypothetical protein n=1 Tax=Staphylococcus aureus TaxID=1280 RepID=UPI0038B312E6
GSYGHQLPSALSPLGCNARSILARHTTQQWAIHAPRHPAPRPSRRAGRVHLMAEGEPIEVQVLHLTDPEARQMAAGAL